MSKFWLLIPILLITGCSPILTITAKYIKLGISCHPNKNNAR